MLVVEIIYILRASIKNSTNRSIRAGETCDGA
jgi:hypothetical protein